MDAFAVADEQVVGLETTERARRPKPEHGVEARRLGAGPEEGNRAERVRNEQEPALRPPERDLAPPAGAHDRPELERRPGKLARNDVVWDAEAFCHGGAVAVVTVEQLHDSGRLSELLDRVVEIGPVDGVEEPDAPVDLERVRRAPHPLLVVQPADRAGDLVDDPHASVTPGN